MTTPLKYILFLVLLFTFSQGLNAQQVADKGSLSLSAGYLSYGSDNSLFFPSEIKTGRMVLRADYLHSILPWLKAGIEGSWSAVHLPEKQNSDIITLSSHNEQLITAGLNVTFCTPRVNTGKGFRPRFQLGIAPTIVRHTGTRKMIIDNMIYQPGTTEPLEAVLTIGTSTRPGLSITPAIEYQVFKFLGFRLSANTLLTTLKSDQTTEKMAFHSLNFGVVVPISGKNPSAD